MEEGRVFAQVLQNEGALESEWDPEYFIPSGSAKHKPGSGGSLEGTSSRRGRGRGRGEGRIVKHHHWTNC